VSGLPTVDAPCFLDVVSAFHVLEQVSDPVAVLPVSWATPPECPRRSEWRPHTSGRGRGQHRRQGYLERNCVSDCSDVVSDATASVAALLVDDVAEGAAGQVAAEVVVEDGRDLGRYAGAGDVGSDDDVVERP
jgi:hypothetical protein